jgi:hypothetical protein
VSLTRTIVACLPVAGICALALSIWPDDARGLVQALWLGGTIALASAGFWVAATAMRAPERSALLRLLPVRRG